MLPAGNVCCVGLSPRFAGGTLGRHRIGELAHLYVLLLQHLQATAPGDSNRQRSPEMHVGRTGPRRLASERSACSSRNSRRGSDACSSRSTTASKAAHSLRSCCCHAATTSRPAAADSGDTTCANIPPAKNALLGISATVAKRLIQAADAVVQTSKEHQVSGAPRIEVAVRKHTRHTENSASAPTLFQPSSAHSFARTGSIHALYGPSPTVLS
jgi:hypothetical protein